MCNYFIRDIRRVPKHLTLDASTALANTLVSSRLDYCNCLQHSLPGVHLNKLQRVQNALARVVTKSTRLNSTKAMLERLYWLPIASRIDFKIATLTYKAVHLKQTPCLAQQLKLKSMHLNTRTMINCFFNILLWLLAVIDVMLSAIRRQQFGINFHTKFGNFI